MKLFDDTQINYHSCFWHWLNRPSSWWFVVFFQGYALCQLYVMAVAQCSQSCGSTWHLRKYSPFWKWAECQRVSFRNLHEISKIGLKYTFKFIQFATIMLWWKFGSFTFKKNTPCALYLRNLWRFHSDNNDTFLPHRMSRIFCDRYKLNDVTLSLYILIYCSRNCKK